MRISKRFDSNELIDSFLEELCSWEVTKIRILYERRWVVGQNYSSDEFW